MRNPEIDKRAQAEAKTLREHGLTLTDYLQREINRGRSDVSIARDFDVHRHTIRAWRTETKSVVIKTVTITRQRRCVTKPKGA